MKRSIHAAAVQMYAYPGQVARNLSIAETLVRRAASGGAELVVLPEFFNIGYRYSDDNYVLSEWRQGQTWRWLTGLAVELKIHLAGTLLLRKGGDLFDTMVLAAPDGQTWEYDKQQPFGWERAYFKPGDRPVVAETELGRIGMLIGWDCAYPAHFAAYAGRADLLIISSAAPQFHTLTLQMPNGERQELGKSHPVANRLRAQTGGLFRDNVRAQCAALGVPFVLAAPPPDGRLHTRIPRARIGYLLMTLPTPRYWRHLAWVSQARTDIAFFADSQVVAADGRVVTSDAPGRDVVQATVQVESERPAGRDVVQATVRFESERPTGREVVQTTVDDKTERPAGTQPPSGLLAEPYLIERVINRLMKPEYEAAMGRQALNNARFLLSLAALLAALYWLGRWQSRFSGRHRQPALE